MFVKKRLIEPLSLFFYKKNLLNYESPDKFSKNSV